MMTTYSTPEEWAALIPQGFHPAYTYPDGRTPQVEPHRLLWYCDKHRPELRERLGPGPLNGDRVFYVRSAEDAPTLPLRTVGEIKHRGWDIATEWAIDGAGTPWVGGGHGEDLIRWAVEDFLKLLQDEDFPEGEINGIRVHLRLPPAEPSWMAKARAAGWGPLDPK